MYNNKIIADKKVTFSHVDFTLLPEIQQLALNYPYPHNILGTPLAIDYVTGLCLKSNQNTHEGWFVLINKDQVVCAAHLSIYGHGDGTHRLWKIRHPLFKENYSCLISDLLCDIFNHIRSLSNKSAKVVLFLGTNENIVKNEAIMSGMSQEATLNDYYRLGESCIILGKTIIK